MTAKEFTESFNTTLVTVYRRIQKQKRQKNYCFNTTLVTVYRNLDHIIDSYTGFQYNPCYCLSILVKTIGEFGILFQYNPCYCLSL